MCRSAEGKLRLSCRAMDKTPKIIKFGDMTFSQYLFLIHEASSTVGVLSKCMSIRVMCWKIIILEPEHFSIRYHQRDARPSSPPPFPSSSSPPHI